MLRKILFLILSTAILPWRAIAGDLDPIIPMVERLAYKAASVPDPFELCEGFRFKLHRGYGSDFIDLNAGGIVHVNLGTLTQEDVATLTPLLGFQSQYLDPSSGHDLGRILFPSLYVTGSYNPAIAAQSDLARIWVNLHLEESIHAWERFSPQRNALLFTPAYRDYLKRNWFRAHFNSEAYATAFLEEYLGRPHSRLEINQHFDTRFPYVRGRNPRLIPKPPLMLQGPIRPDTPPLPPGSRGAGPSVSRGSAGVGIQLTEAFSPVRACPSSSFWSRVAQGVRFNGPPAAGAIGSGIFFDVMFRQAAGDLGFGESGQHWIGASASYVGGSLVYADLARVAYSSIVCNPTNAFIAGLVALDTSPAARESHKFWLEKQSEAMDYYQQVYRNPKSTAQDRWAATGYLLGSNPTWP